MGNVVSLCTSQTTCDACYDPTFKGLGIPVSRSCSYAAILKRMDELRLPYHNSVSLLQGFQTHRTWDIYLFFSSWSGPVTAACVTRMMEQFRAAHREWMSKLRGYNGFTTQNVRVRLFGFVFCRGVQTDATFNKKYGAYPTVREWMDTSETSPWIVSANTSTRNMYLPDLDLHTIRVVGNRTQGTATFFPPVWDESYRHPEGCVGYQTRFWNGTDVWSATAQRHYLRVSKVLKDPPNGEFGDHLKILKHEMGHCFFLDDLYDKKKYPAPLPNVTCSCEPNGHCMVHTDDTIMHGGPVITPFDHAQLRHVWNASRAVTERRRTS